MLLQTKKNSYISISRNAGRGVFAKRKLNKSVVVGYFSGPILNSVTFDLVKQEFTSYIRWSHPVSRKKYSTYFEVATPSKYINSGVHPRYLRDPERYPISANVDLYPTVRWIKNKYRPVAVLKTIRKIERDRELLLDYGDIHASIYFEFLRREKLVQSTESKDRFARFLSDIFHSRAPSRCSRFRCDISDDDEFLESIAYDYFNGDLV